MLHSLFNDLAFRNIKLNLCYFTENGYLTLNAKFSGNVIYVDRKIRIRIINTKWKRAPTCLFTCKHPRLIQFCGRFLSFSIFFSIYIFLCTLSAELDIFSFYLCNIFFFSHRKVAKTFAFLARNAKQMNWQWKRYIFNLFVAISSHSFILNNNVVTIYLYFFQFSHFLACSVILHIFCPCFIYVN